MKVALIKPGPVNGIRGWRSPALPEFDPFWRDVEAAGLPILLHASCPPLDDYIAKWEPPRTQNFMAQRAFRWMALGHREITDMITSLICHATLTRFPKLRIASVENGSSWIFPLFHDFEDLYKKMPQNFPEHPHDVFRSQHLGEPVLGGLRGRRGEHGRLGPGAVSGRTTRTPRAWPNRGVSGAMPKAWTSGAPTTSWATTRGGSRAYRSPIPTPTPSSRRPCRPRDRGGASRNFGGASPLTKAGRAPRRGRDFRLGFRRAARRRRDRGE